MFKRTVKQNLLQSPEGARLLIIYSVLLSHQRAWPVSLCQRRIGWKSLIFHTPSHLAPSFGVIPFEFIEKLYGSWSFPGSRW